MGANPFDKCGFGCYREWEESLIDFFIKESANPETAEWLIFAVDDESRRTVAFCALLLSNLLENNPGYKASSDKVGEVYAALKNESMGHVQYGEWLRAGWLNVTRIADAIKFRLKN
jgi:hypothetical protein